MKLILVFSFILFGCCLEGCRFESAVEAVVETSEDTKPLQGVWLCKRYYQETELNLLLLKFSKSGDRTIVTIKEMQKSFVPITVTSAKFENSELTINFTGDQGDIFFKGILKNKERGIYKGITRMSTGDTVFTSLEKTDLTDMSNLEPTVRAAETTFFKKCLEKEDKIAAMNEFIKKWPDSHLAFNAYEGLLDFSIFTKKPQAEVTSLFQQWLESTNSNWGDLKQGYMYSKTIKVLGNTGYPLEYISQFEKELNEKVKTLTEAEITLVNVGKAFAKLHSPDQETNEKGIQEFLEMYNKDINTLYPYYVVLRNYHFKKNYNKVVEYGVIFNALPWLVVNLENQIGMGFENPREMFFNACIQLKKTPDEISEITRTTYPKLLKKYIETGDIKLSEEKLKNKVILEMHTCGSGKDVVALELAVDYAVNKYGKDKVIVMTYHQNQPDADPLATLQGEERLRYYEVVYSIDPKKTPILFINGAHIKDIEGDFSRLKQVVEIVDQNIQHAGNFPSEFDLDLKCKVEAELIHVHLKADKLPTDFLKVQPHVQIVLLEDDLFYSLPSGMNYQDHFVRSTAFGVGAHPVSQKENSLDVTFNVKEIKKELDQYLQVYEKK